MDGYYSNNGCNNGGYRRSGNCGSYCGSCPNGQCPRMEAGGNGSGAQGQSRPGCPGGNCCPGGCCPTGRSRFGQDWQSGGRQH
ncbi:keratin-associated protein 17-1 [Drosophila biarmipes]|uniref:keratin-associated protein 17-1 n=1 Tax=Drosophila biarmipes TaxID=125945 RepID=UPI0007E67961|nr:keratin-associated protein 17-1 [Drosophila biarmipes]XP_016963290.1 keratin-associated protein 17-1 [Drosophila biarmipes]